MTSLIRVSDVDIYLFTIHAFLNILSLPDPTAFLFWHFG